MLEFNSRKLLANQFFVQSPIPDFEPYIAEIDDKKTKAQLQGYVKVLRQGKNPFTKEELEKLRSGE